MRKLRQEHRRCRSRACRTHLIMRTVEIDGKRYLWHDILKARREQVKAAEQPQPTLFEPKDDRRPASQTTVAGRFPEPRVSRWIDAERSVRDHREPLLDGRSRTREKSRATVLQEVTITLAPLCAGLSIYLYPAEIPRNSVSRLDISAVCINSSQFTSAGPSSPSLPSTRPERHTKSHCLLIRRFHAPLESAPNHRRCHFLARERLQHTDIFLRPRRGFVASSIPVLHAPMLLTKQRGS